MKGSRTVFRTEWFSVEEEWFDEVASLRDKPHYRITSSDGVIVLALTEREEIVLVRQFRPAVRQVTLELPCGGVDEGESPLEAARRELHEETGFVCPTLSALGPGRIMANRHAAHEFAFIGTGAVRDPAFVPKEDIEVVLVTPEAFRRLVTTGQFQQLAALGVVLLVEWKLGRPLAALGAMR